MFRTESKTEVVWSETAARSSEHISSGTLQRDSHDHAPRSTRPRRRLRQANHSPGRSTDGRDHRLFTGPGHQSEGGRPGSASVDHAEGTSLVRARPAGRDGSGWRRRRRLDPRRPGAITSLPVGSFLAECDLAVDRPGLSRADASDPRDRPGSLVLRATSRHRSGRDQSNRHPRLHAVRWTTPSIAGGSKSSPAPVAGGGASPLRLPGDRSRPARCPEVDRGGPPGTTPSPSAFVTHRSLFRSESSILDGVSS